MIHDIGSRTWKMLRYMVRKQKQACTGKELRIDMSRYTKDGKFLMELCQKGLISCVLYKDKWKECEFILLPAGIDAAEYGEYVGDNSGVALTTNYVPARKEFARICGRVRSK